MYRLKIIFIFSLLSLYSIHAQKVSNVSNRQEQSTIIVSYDLETKTPCKIALFVSTNGGTTWQGPLKKVTGDIGAKVSSGNKSIIWSVLEEFDEFRGSNIVFQVRAISNELQTIKIGSQEWTKKNLDVSTYRNGDIIPEVKNPSMFTRLTTGAWCYYNNDPENGKTYGKLYNWYAIDDPRGLAPEGYHIPSAKEVDLLLDYLGGGDIGYKLKEAGTKHWNEPNYYIGNSNIYQMNSNSSNFTGLPGGTRKETGEFVGIGNKGAWWCFNYSDSAGFFYLDNYSHSVRPSTPKYKTYGFSVRCLSD